MSVPAHLETFESLRAPWRDMAQAMANPFPFTHPAWVQAWWETCSGAQESALLAIRDGGGLLGIAPLMRSGDTLAFMADTDVCDYHDFVYPAGAEERFFPRLLDALDGLDWRQAVLEGIQEDSPTLQRLPEAARARGLEAAMAREEASPQIPIAPTWEAYLESLGKKDRHELRRKFRRLERSGALTFYAAGPSDLQRDLDDFLRLLRSSREDKAAFLTEGRERFFRRLAEAMAREEYLKLFFLELDGVRVAASFCFDYLGAYYLYNSGYDTEYGVLSVGLLLKALCLRDAIERGRRRFDLLRGPETYKYHLGAGDRWLYRLTLQRPG